MSLTTRAVVAILLMIGFYILALGISAGHLPVLAEKAACA
jgi:membrane-bound ClpP family serine protease